MFRDSTNADRGLNVETQTVGQTCLSINFHHSFCFYAYLTLWGPDNCNNNNAWSSPIQEGVELIAVIPYWRNCSEAHDLIFKFLWELIGCGSSLWYVLPECLNNQAMMFWVYEFLPVSLGTKYSKLLFTYSNSHITYLTEALRKWHRYIVYIHPSLGCTHRQSPEHLFDLPVSTSVFIGGTGRKVCKDWLWGL